MLTVLSAPVIFDVVALLVLIQVLPHPTLLESCAVALGLQHKHAECSRTPRLLLETLNVS